MSEADVQQLALRIRHLKALVPVLLELVKVQQLIKLPFELNGHACVYKNTRDDGPPLSQKRFVAHWRIPLEGYLFSIPRATTTQLSHQRVWIRSDGLIVWDYEYVHRRIRRKAATVVLDLDRLSVDDLLALRDGLIALQKHP